MASEEFTFRRELEMTSLFDLGRKYIWGKTELQQSKVTRSLNKNLNIVENKSSNADPSMLEAIACKEPLVLKAIYKKNRDIFKNWFVIRPVDEKDKIDPMVLKILKDFDKKTNFPNKLYVSGVCANIYGTGFIEKIYNEHGNSKAMNPPGDNAKLVDLNLLSSKHITSRKKSDKKGDSILYPVFKKGFTDEVLIHPDRLSVVRTDWLPGNFFGISKVYVMMNILKSKMTADQASGDFVDWVSKGITDVTIKGMQDEQEKSATKVLKSHPNTLIHDEDYSVAVHNPARIDLGSFFDYFYVNIAAGLEMPKHVLIGSETGNVTGSEVGISSYYGDVQNIQTLVFTPIIEDIYKEVLAAHGKEWKYEIYWNPIFVDELSEAKILQTRAYSATQTVASNIISIPEARKMLNEGVVKLDADKVPEVEKPPQPTTDPNVEPQPVIKPQSRIRPLTEFEKKMIEKYRKIGEEILKEQDNMD